ncbi:lipoma-preferred partner homolog [Belonocnema kinseyi]|uniref:lipoma-preferred partner homolog n=1 Tax=Belonocnema kinseyi TaxID=2817044 RepID=UPI00143DC888|nr:lipoma-preferred partner homolog [Belonocnema kinseyi]
MSNIGNLDQQIASLQINHGDGNIETVKSGKKVGPAVPPKPKKSQPQVPQSYTIKAASIPSYSTVLNNTGSNEKAANIYMNSPTPYAALKLEKNEFTCPAPTNGGGKPAKFYQNNENFYTNQEEKFEPKYSYDDKHFYSNVGNIAAPQVPVDDRSAGAGKNALYSNVVESTMPISIPHSSKQEKDLVYSNIQWNTKPENTYSNIPGGHSTETGLGGGGSSSGGGGKLPGKQGTYSVDALTDLLVQGMEDNSEDNDIYGICAECGHKVEGEGTGCSAMDKVFHITCFCCFICRINLQGKPFYSLEGKPYCEEDYLNTLEKCCVCTRPVLDRILRATGKPYHPSCFTCVVCGQSLDGIPFTVDATNQIHCIQCFHK